MIGPRINEYLKGRQTRVMQKNTILLVDDNFYLRESLTGTLKREGYLITVAEKAKEAFEWLQKASFDLVILARIFICSVIDARP
jgi:PleD family two-component response regulator